MITRTSLGAKISGLRKSRGLSQELIAENAKVSLRTIQRVEAGDAIPRTSTLTLIAYALGVKVEELTANEDALGSQTKMEIEKLRLINLSGLTSFLFPLLNIILPLVIWRKNKNLPLVNSLGRRVISYQILWTVGSAILLILFQVLQVSITGSVAIGHIPPTIFVVYVASLSVNLFFVVRAARQLNVEALKIYSTVPTLF